MFLSEWCEFPSAPCLAGKRTWWQLTSPCCWSHAHPWHASELVPFLVGLRTYQHLDMLLQRQGSYRTVTLNCLSITYIVLSAFKLHWKWNIFTFFNILSEKPENELCVLNFSDKVHFCSTVMKNGVMNCGFQVHLALSVNHHCVHRQTFLQRGYYGSVNSVIN